MGSHPVVFMYQQHYCRINIDEARVISALQHRSKFNFYLFWKENEIFGSHAVVLVRPFHWYYTVGLILTNLGWILFTGYGRTDRQTWFMNFHVETCRHTKIFNSKLGVNCLIDRYMRPRMTWMYRYYKLQHKLIQRLWFNLIKITDWSRDLVKPKPCQ